MTTKSEEPGRGSGHNQASNNEQHTMTAGELEALVKRGAIEFSPDPELTRIALSAVVKGKVDKKHIPTLTAHGYIDRRGENEFMLSDAADHQLRVLYSKAMSRLDERKQGESVRKAAQQRIEQWRDLAASCVKGGLLTVNEGVYELTELGKDRVGESLQSSLVHKHDYLDRWGYPLSLHGVRVGKEGEADKRGCYNMTGKLAKIRKTLTTEELRALGVKVKPLPKLSEDELMFRDLLLRRAVCQ